MTKVDGCSAVKRKIVPILQKLTPNRDLLQTFYIILLIVNNRFFAAAAQKNNFKFSIFENSSVAKQFLSENVNNRHRYKRDNAGFAEEINNPNFG